jgi:hypothetical protein
MGKFGYRDRNTTERLSWDYEGRDWGDVSTSQGSPQIASQPPVARREAWKPLFPTVLKRNQWFDLGLVASITVRKYISVVISTQFVVLYYGSPSKLIKVCLCILYLPWNSVILSTFQVLNSQSWPMATIFDHGAWGRQFVYPQKCWLAWGDKGIRNPRTFKFKCKNFLKVWFSLKTYEMGRC